MKHLPLSLLSAFILPITVKAEVSEEIHNRCIEANDYSGCVRTNQGVTTKVTRKMTGIGVTLFLNSDTAELTIKSVINSSPASDADIESGDVILRIDGKSTKGMGLKEAIKLIKGPKDKPIKLVIDRTNEKGKRKKIEFNLIRDTFIIPERESFNQLNIREFFNYSFPRDLQPINPQGAYPLEPKKELFPDSQI
tara:strand:+ start:860 stop:1441 length:582 start_codon:yes stop_codon:yes gene_type:complete